MIREKVEKRVKEKRVTEELKAIEREQNVCIAEETKIKINEMKKLRKTNRNSVKLQFGASRNEVLFI